MAQPDHQIWGEPEVLSCYSTSDTRSKKKLPSALAQHVATNVTMLLSSHSETGGEVPPPTGTTVRAILSQARAVEDSGDASGFNNAGDAPSMGSGGHNTGDCKPCLYMSTKTGCFNGRQCTFCHYTHSKKNRPRPCKATRLQCKQIASMLNTFVANPEQLLDAADKQTSTAGPSSDYMRSLLKTKRQDSTDSTTTG
eukprot:CAMPEP_0179348024 /NCGR_PEP_ID=MMETSP0797-20121207/73479_1 /TAXON_ID=47934 /ORGANISM="Dinophysis acuminata, Strain DAEP01" /LENGTH=195 /DNA_ID=CAMNT_0021062797 /DNA_START=48 /DNA_END=635 /DNA_ORIENTATION=+